MDKKKLKCICRLRTGYVELPCNWVKDGNCGADAHPCVILKYIE